MEPVFLEKNYFPSIYVGNDKVNQINKVNELIIGTLSIFQKTQFAGRLFCKPSICNLKNKLFEMFDQ